MMLANRPALADVPVLSYGPNHRLAPRLFGDVTIRVHKGVAPKPTGEDRVTVSDFALEPAAYYDPARKAGRRHGESYRAARRNAARVYRRRHAAT